MNIDLLVINRKYSLGKAKEYDNFTILRSFDSDGHIFREGDSESTGGGFESRVEAWICSV